MTDCDITMSMRQAMSLRDSLESVLKRYINSDTRGVYVNVIIRGLMRMENKK